MKDQQRYISAERSLIEMKYNTNLFDSSKNIIFHFVLLVPLNIKQDFVGFSSHCFLFLCFLDNSHQGLNLNHREKNTLMPHETKFHKKQHLKLLIFYH